MNSNPNDDLREIEDLLVEWECARQAGEELTVAQLCEHRPDLAEEAARRIAVLQQLSWLSDPINELYETDASNTLAEQAIESVDETQIPDSDVTVAEFLDTLTNSGVLTKREIDELRLAAADNKQQRAFALAHQLVEENVITPYQAKVILERGDSPLLLDRYVILDSIGSGGMGIVFKALQRTLERIVAVKVLPRHAVDSPEKIERFQREMRAAAKLSHPNVVQAFDAHESNGVYFFAMEYVPGCDLSELVGAYGTLPVEQALDILSQAASGLANAHQNGIIHRDVKPGNILLSDDGVAKVLDLGLARVREVASPATSLTSDGLTMGTVAYMSPEQAFDAKQADERSDIYSLGCTLYFLLQGRPVFDEPNSVQTVIAHREVPPPKLGEGRSDVPDKLEQLFQSMVAKNPNARPASMSAVQHDLEILMQADSGSEATQPESDQHLTATDEDSVADHAIATATNRQHAEVAADRKPQAESPSPPSKWWIALAVVAASLALSFYLIPRAGLQFTQETLATQLISDEVSLIVRTATEEYQADFVEDLPDDAFTIAGAILYPTDAVDLGVIAELPNLQSLHIVCQSDDVLPLGKLGGKEQFRDLSEVSLDGYQVSTEALAWLADLPGLTYLDVTGCELPTGWSKQLANASSLTDLILVQTATKNHDLVELARLKNLQLLDVSNTLVTSDGLRHISSLPISELGLTGIKLTDSFHAIEEFKQLRRLYVDGTNFSDRMAQSTAASLSKLKLLHVGHTELTPPGVRELTRIRSLREFGVRGLQISSAIDDIAKLTNLRDLLADNTDLSDSDLDKLSELKRLSLLQIAGTRVSDTAIERFRLRVPSCVVSTKTFDDQLLEVLPRP